MNLVILFELRYQSIRRNPVCCSWSTNTPPPPIFWLGQIKVMFAPQGQNKTPQGKSPLEGARKGQFEKLVWCLFLIRCNLWVIIFFGQQGQKRGPQGLRPMQDALQGQDRGMVRAPRRGQNQKKRKLPLPYFCAPSPKYGIFPSIKIMYLIAILRLRLI